jgi:UDP-N-acetyl-D-galactosamine dehydrogenase
MLDEYGIHVHRVDELQSLNALILAVPHAEYGELGAERLWRMVEDGGLFVDIKSKFRPEALRPDLVYWSL